MTGPPRRRTPAPAAALALLVAAFSPGCAGSETTPAGTPIHDESAGDPATAERHDAPPLGRPRPKLIPGDVLRREESDSDE